METVELFVDEDGIQAIWDDRLADVLEGGDTRRASHVEPVAGGWQADLKPVGGPLSPVFKLRGEALAWEVEWLTRELHERRLHCSGA